MATLNSVGQVWKIASEIDVTNIQEDAKLTPRLALIGSPEKTGALQGYLQRGPHSAAQPITATPTYRLPLSHSDVAALAEYDLRVIVLDDPEQLSRDDVAAVAAQPAALLAVLDAAPGAPIGLVASGTTHRPPVGPEQLLIAPLDSVESVQKTLIPAIMEPLRGREVALGRAYPGLRPAVSHKLIHDTCLANAAYAAGTGVAEMVPGLGIPFAVADIFILTKNQIILAYKIAMTMGESGALRDVLPQFASVVGAGFLWRQVARELLGFLPLGIVLKVAVAYAGTYVTGNAVYHWYATGEKLKEKDLKALFQEALHRGQQVAEQLTARFRKEQRPVALLEAPSGGEGGAGATSEPASGRPSRRPKAKGLTLPKLKRSERR